MDAPFRILVVDDEFSVLELISDILEEAGYDVVTEESPVEALGLVERERFDVMLLDVYMPELPGMLLHAKVRFIDKDLARHTVFVSGHFTRQELKRDLEESQLLLPKPFEPQELIAMVERVLPERPRSAA